MFLKIYKPEIFQGNLKKNNYFEGWYFKHVSSDLEQVWSFIPGVSLTSHDPHAFIQVINGLPEKQIILNIRWNSLPGRRNRLYLKIGDSVFTDKYIDLNIDNENL